MPKFEHFKLTLKLKAQSPMIHFQGLQSGATLRASEVKPKLDRFLINKLEAEKERSKDSLQKDEIYKKFFLSNVGGKDSYALNYRMQIYCEEAPKCFEITYPIYFANSSKKSADERKYGVLSNPTVVIHCFVKELQDLLSKHLEEFFLVTNFGTMSSKGFGSFVPEAYILDSSEVADYLKHSCGTDICLRMPATKGKDSLDYSKTFENIRLFYRLMKSGINETNNRDEGRGYARSFLFLYMHDLGISNEKAWMKNRGISPIVSTKGKEVLSPAGQPHKYVRAFLGTANAFRYKTAPSGGGNISISINSDKNNSKKKELARVPSPILFKIIDDMVFISAFPVSEKVYGKEFIFSGKKGGYNEGRISTPESSLFDDGKFDMKDFLQKYKEYYNKIVKGKVLDCLSNAPEVKEL